MKLIKLVSLTGLVLTSSQLIAETIDNSQIMPPPGPYHSVVSNNAPTKIMSQAEQSAQMNSANSQMPQGCHGFHGSNQSMPDSTMHVPEWVLKQQQAVQNDIEKMLKENTKRYNENQKNYNEYLTEYKKLADKRENERRQWVDENNKKMMQSWKEMLDQYAKNQKQQIESAENMPEWMKQQMLKQHQQQLAMMNANPPVSMNTLQQPQQAVPAQSSGRVMPNISQPQMRSMMNRMDMNYPMMQQAPQRQPYMGQPPMTPYNNFRR